MTAMTVPPPGWVPIGAREIQRLARRHLGRALALSTLGHVALLALLLWAGARHPDETGPLFLSPVNLIPLPPAIDMPPLPSYVPSRPAPSDDGGIPIPKRLRPAIDPGEVVLPTVPGAPTEAGPSPHDRTDVHGTGPTIDASPPLPREPAETESVPHDQEPVPLFHPDPEYPGWARESGVQGTVQLHVLVGQDGLVKRVVIRKDVIGLGEAAQAGIARWTFRPAMDHGHPVALWILIPVRFWLQ